MESPKVMRRIISFLVVVLAVGGFSPSLMAREFSATEIRSRMEDMNVELATLETHDYSDESAAEFAQCRLEVGEIQGLLSRNEIGLAAIVLQRLEARMSLIESTLERATYEALAQERETELFEIQEQADALQVELLSAEQRRATLQQEVAAIVESMEEK
jgi:hypothetical protein